MADRTKIAWTDATWNPIVGCTRVSEGCRHCYAERVAFRVGQFALGRGTVSKYAGTVRMHEDGPRWTGEVRFVDEALILPLSWQRPRRIFVNSMSDMFHEKVATEWIDVIFAIMWARGRHVFQVLTKRPERMCEYAASLLDHDDRVGFFIDALRRHDLGEWIPDPLRQAQGEMLPNVWLGVSIESRNHLDRLDRLRQTPAARRFVSFEPLLEDLGDVDLTGIDQAIFGGESGPKARPCDLAWIRGGMRRARTAGCNVFVKQLGARPRIHGQEFGREIQGERVPQWRPLRDRAGADASEWPEDLRVQEWPR